MISVFPLLFACLAAPAKADDGAVGKLTYQDDIAPLMAKYCLDCHSGTKPKGGLDLSGPGDDSIAGKDPKKWEAVLDNVAGGIMPPEGKPRPTDEEANRLVVWIERSLSTANCVGPLDPGRVTLRRMNKAEYNNTIRDLFYGLDARPADDFPSDDVGYGFDNIGDVLTIPPILMERYMIAAEAVSQRAIIADENRLKAPIKHRESSELKAGEQGAAYKDIGRIFATNGELATEHRFWKDAEYILRVRAFADQAGNEPAKLAIRLDGKDIQTFDVTATEDNPGVYEVKLAIEHGKRRIGFAFLNDFYDEKLPEGKRDRNMIFDWVEVQGPLGEWDVPEAHKKVIFKRPDDKEQWRDVAREILTQFATRAYRRPATLDEVDRLLALFDMAATDGENFEGCIQLAVQAVLSSPHFLFKVEYDPDSDRAQPINDYELATRLSYFLWSSMPDDELFDLAAQGKLHDDETLDAQVARMLKDPKAQALVENFAGQWLQLRNLRNVNPDTGKFRAWDDRLRQSMQQETELFFRSIVEEDRSILDFLDADYTFLDERLAKHYGIDDVKGREFRRVELKDDRRGGILTQASILTVTSNPTRTSPVKRGKWILEQVLGTPPPPPPPNVPELEQSRLTGSLRQRMEQHRENPSCASCHARMDPLGFGFENYDAIGAWRDKDEDYDIDPAGTLPSGQSFRGPKELKTILLERKDEFARNLAEKLLTYALGRGLDYPDRCAVDRIREAVAGDGYRFGRLVREIVKSDSFRKRRGKEQAS